MQKQSTAPKRSEQKFHCHACCEWSSVPPPPNLIIENKTWRGLFKTINSKMKVVSKLRTWRVKNSNLCSQNVGNRDRLSKDHQLNNVLQCLSCWPKIECCNLNWVICLTFELINLVNRNMNFCTCYGFPWSLTSSSNVACRHSGMPWASKVAAYMKGGFAWARIDSKGRICPLF